MKKKNQYRDFSGSTQNRVQLDPKETNDASQSTMTIWKDISSWFTEEMQICRKEKSLRAQKDPHSSQRYAFIGWKYSGFTVNLVKPGFILVRFRRSLITA